MTITHQLEIKPKRMLTAIMASVVALTICAAGANSPGANVSAASIESFEPITHIKLQVESFIQTLADEDHPLSTRTTIEVKTPDPRISLADCLSPAISLHGVNQLRSRNLVKLNCGQGKILHLVVFTMIYQPVVIAASSLVRNTTLTDLHLALREVDILQINRAVFMATSDVAGMQARRSIRAGTVITTAMLTAPTLIKRGDKVVIRAARGKLVVRMPGIAMASGTLGEQINVKNESSGRIVKGWVRGAGEVHVPF